MLETFKKVFDCGYLKPNHARSLTDKTWIFIVKDRKDLENKVIPFFKKYKLRTNKLQDFNKFCWILEQIKSKNHLKIDGFKRIVNKILRDEQFGHRRYSKSYILSHLN